MPKCEGFILNLSMGKYSSTSVVVSYDFDGHLIKIYKTAREASDNLNVFTRSVDKAIRRGSTLKGYQWRRYICIDDVKTSIERYQKPIYKKDSIKVIKKDQNGNILEVYPSINKAAKDNNISPKQIRDCLNGFQNKAASFYWEKIKK